MAGPEGRLRKWLAAFSHRPHWMGLLSAALAAVLLAPLLVRIESGQRRLLEERERRNLLNDTDPYVRALADALNRKIVLQEALFAFTETRRKRPEFAADFQTFAAGLYSSSRGVRALEVMPGGIVRHLYPHEGNEDILGRNIYLHPSEEVRADIQRCIETRRLTLTGPIELWQGGQGFIARKAVFEGDRVWGFVTTVIDLPTVFQESGLESLIPAVRVGVRDARQRVFWGDPSVFDQEPVTHTITLADGEWVAAFVPAAGWGAESKGDLAWTRAALATCLIFLCAMSWLAAERISRMAGLIKTREQQYRSVLDSLPVLIAEIGPDGRYRYANRERCEWFGSTPKELEGQRFSAVLRPAGMPDLLDAVDRGINGVPARLELTLPHPTKGLRRLDVQVIPKRDTRGNLDGLYLLGIDITHPSEVEEERNRFFMLSNELLCIATTGGYFKTLNPAWQAALGYTSEELMAKPFLEFIHPDDRAATEDALEQLRQGKRITAFENRYRAKDGAYHWLRWNATPSSDGQLIYAAAHDATEQRQLEEQLRQAQKLESVGRLAGGIAHDFNNLLTIINGYSALVLARMEEGRVRDSIIEIQKAGERAASLTQQLLAFSRKQVLQARPIDLNALIADAQKMIRRLIGEDIELTSELAAGLGPVLADAAQLNQILLNLAVNARDAMPGGGKLTIRTENVRLDEASRASFPELEPGDYVLWSISDTGVGMDEHVKAHLFEPFFTTKPQGIGTGLGLSTVYGIVRQSRGWIGVVSEPGKGATFRILLPSAAGGKPAPEAAFAPGTIRGCETVLIAEDQTELRSFASQVLRENGYRVIEAGCGREALERAAESQGAIHLLLTDVIMPGMTGAELAKEFRALQPEAGVLLMSGYPGGEETVDLRKPFTPEELLAAVRRALDGVQ